MLTRAKARSGRVPTVTDMLISPVNTHDQYHTSGDRIMAELTDSAPKEVQKRSCKRKFNANDLYDELENLPLCGAVEPTTPITTSILGEETDLQVRHDAPQHECEDQSPETPITTVPAIADVGVKSYVKTPVQSQEKVKKLCTIFEKDDAEKSTKIEVFQHSGYKGYKLSYKKVSTPAKVNEDVVPITHGCADDIYTFSDSKPRKRNCRNAKDVYQPKQTAAKTTKPDITPSKSVTKNYENLMKRRSGSAAEEAMDTSEPEETWTVTPTPSTRRSHPTRVSSTKRIASTTHGSSAKQTGKVRSPDLLSPDSLFLDKNHKRKSHNLLSLNPMKYSQLYSPDECETSTSRRKAKVKYDMLDRKHADAAVTTLTDNQTQDSEMETDMNDCKPPVQVKAEILNRDGEMKPNTAVTKPHVIKDTKTLQSVATRIELPLKLESHTNCHDNCNESSQVIMNRVDGSELDSSDDESDLTDYDDIVGLGDGMEKSNLWCTQSTSLSTFTVEMKHAIDEASDTASETASLVNESTKSELPMSMGSSENNTESMESNPIDVSLPETASSTVECPHPQNATEYDADCESNGLYEFIAVYLFDTNEDLAVDPSPKCKKRACDLFMDKSMAPDSIPPNSKRLRTDIEETNSAISNQTHESETHADSDVGDDLLPFDSPILNKIQSIREIVELFSSDYVTNQTMEETPSDLAPINGTTSKVIDQQTCQPQSSETTSTYTSSPDDETKTYPVYVQPVYDYCDNVVSNCPVEPASMSSHTPFVPGVPSSYIPPEYSVDHTYNTTGAAPSSHWNTPAITSGQYVATNVEPAYHPVSHHGDVRPQYECMYQSGLPKSAPEYYGMQLPVTNNAMDVPPVSNVSPSTTDQCRHTDNYGQYSYRSEEISYLSMTKNDQPPSQCLYQPSLSASVMETTIESHVQLPTTTQDVKPVAPVDVTTNTAPAVDATANPGLTTIPPAVDIVPRPPNGVNVSNSQQATCTSVIAGVETAVAARVKHWLHQYGSAEHEFQLMDALKDIKPYVISGWISATYLRALMTKSDLISEMFDNTLDEAGDIHKWIVDNCRKNTAAILARDLVFRMFTLGELSGFNLQKLSKTKKAAIRRCLKRQFRDNYNINIWKGKCLPLIKSSVRTLFKHRVKHVQTFWRLNH